MRGGIRRVYAVHSCRCPDNRIHELAGMRIGGIVIPSKTGFGYVVAVVVSVVRKNGIHYVHVPRTTGVSDRATGRHIILL